MCVKLTVGSLNCCTNCVCWCGTLALCGTKPLLGLNDLERVNDDEPEADPGTPKGRGDMS